MSRIRIKNFGPIKEGFDSPDGFMDIKKVTVFIGDQGSGKSTVAKLISIMTWIEKALNRGEIEKGAMSFHEFIEYCSYQGIKSYFLPGTEIEYLGNAYNIKYNTREKYPIIREINNNEYVVPKIMYVPAERNFLSIIESAYDVTGLPDNLTTFAERLKRAQLELNGSKLSLPIRDYSYEYDNDKDISYVSEINDDGFAYQINLREASSGLQSLIPLYLVSRNLANSILSTNANAAISVNQIIRRNDEIAKIMLDDTIPDDEKKIRVNKIHAKFHNKCFINIVEEPEQNLFPTSQKRILESLVEFANLNDGNKLIMTTDSPYIINYLSIAMQACYLADKIHDKIRSYAPAPKVANLLDKLDAIVPPKSNIAADDVVIYELKDGKIIRLPATEGIPSDKNYLNQSLAEGNRLFDSLLEIEEEI